MGERLLCKQEVVGSIPSGSTSGSQSGFEWFVRKYLFSRVADAAREFSDIVKRRSLRAAGEMKISCAAQSPASGRRVRRVTQKVMRRGRRAMHVVSCLTAGDVGPISKQAGLSKSMPAEQESEIRNQEFRVTL